LAGCGDATTPDDLNHRGGPHAGYREHRDGPEPSANPSATAAVAAPADEGPIDWRTFVDQDLPPGAGVAPGLVYPGVTLVGGSPPPDVTSLVLSFVLARAARLPWLGWDTKPGRTVYLNTATAAPRLRWRVRKMLGGLPHPPGPQTVFFLSDRSCKLDTDAGRARVERALAGTQADLLVVDTGNRAAATGTRGLVAALDAILAPRPELCAIVTTGAESAILEDASERVVRLWSQGSGYWDLAVSRPGAADPLETVALRRSPDTLWFKRVASGRIVPDAAATPHPAPSTDGTPSRETFHHGNTAPRH
jgi:hypothetical protein